MTQTLTIQFIGGAETVTGSKYLLSFSGTQILVDCGLFQGVKPLRLRNWKNLPVDPADIDAVVLTHAHIDHSGYIPRLIKDGFRGKIFCTNATFDLCKILLPDSGYLMEEEAEYLNRKKKTKHQPALPLFSLREAEESLRYFSPIEFRKKVKINEHFEVQLNYAGHILGAACAIVSVAGKTLGFTGDIGRPHDPIFFPPDVMPEVDFLITESTYGNRLHSNVDVGDELASLVHSTYDRGGVVLIPAFAVGRAQSMMYYLWKLTKEGKIPKMPMYLNSPMATNVNEVLDRYKNLHRLSANDCNEVCSVVKYVRSVEESIALNDQKGPMLIISASGMLSGGRVLHHLKSFAPHSQNLILLTGYQAAGTRGEALARGAREVKVHGSYVTVKAQVETLQGLSAHADYSEIIAWLSESKMRPKKVFVCHGEPSAADELRRRIEENFNWTAIVPEMNEKAALQ